MIKKLCMLAIISTSVLFAELPYTLFGMKSLYIKVKDQDKLLSDEALSKLQKSIVKNLQSANIKVLDHGPCTILIKFNAEKVNDTYVIYSKLMVGETVIANRHDVNVQSFALTYFNDDIVTSSSVEQDVYDSVIEYLLVEFIEQYKEENEE